MHADNVSARGEKTIAETYIARLIVAASSIAIKNGMLNLWSSLVIDLRKVLTDTVRKRGEELSLVAWCGESDTRQDQLLAELTDGAYRTLLNSGFQGSFLELELGLYWAFKLVVQDMWHHELPVILRKHACAGMLATAKLPAHP